MKILLVRKFIDAGMRLAMSKAVNVEKRCVEMDKGEIDFNLAFEDAKKEFTDGSPLSVIDNMTLKDCFVHGFTSVHSDEIRDLHKNEAENALAGLKDEIRNLVASISEEAENECEDADCPIHGKGGVETSIVH